MNLPKKTYVGKKIPKQRFYENTEIKPNLQKRFVKDIDSITFSNKFSQDTLGIKKTDEVEEIFLFDVSLKAGASVERLEELLEVIDRSVPYPILFRLDINGGELYKIAYKKRNQNDPNKSVVDTYFTREIDSIDRDNFSKEFQRIFNAIDMQILYEKLLRLFLHQKGGKFEDAIDAEKKRIYATNEIERLEKLVVKEKQADRQYEIHGKIKKLKKAIGRD